MQPGQNSENQSKTVVKKEKKKKKKKNPEVSTVTLKGRKLVPRSGSLVRAGGAGFRSRGWSPRAAALPLPAAPSRLFALFPASRQRFCQLRIDSYFV